MPILTFVAHDGTETVAEVPAGANVMRSALAANVAGIVAECGGAAMCATCHVYVDNANVGDFPFVGDLENDMLDCTADQRLPASRLSCQLSMPESDVIVHIPSQQS